MLTRSQASARRPAALSAGLAVFLALGLVAFAFAIAFPPLTGRIVDQANVIPAETRNAIEPKLVDLEQKSGIQLVVATVNSLEGNEIEPYANELFRFWQLGEKAKNNGVLLLVAPNERRVRIEVGYGLEGTLTDALSKVIITNAIAPRFKSGDFGGGISRGVEDIITVLTTDASEWEKRPSLRLDHQQEDNSYLLITVLLIIFVFLMIVSPGFRGLVFTLLANAATSSGGRSSSGGWSGGSSGGGFSGGGGSSGGGGASGSW